MKGYAWNMKYIVHAKADLEWAEASGDPPLCPTKAPLQTSYLLGFDKGNLSKPPESAFNMYFIQ